MARLHFVKRAYKDNPVAKKGEPYFWWQFMRQPKRFSKERPRRSQLTQSSYYSTLYDLEDAKDEISFELCNKDTWKDLIDEIIGLTQDLLDETQDSLDNIPEQLQESSVLNERIDSLENAISEFENLDVEQEAEDLQDEFNEIIFE